MTVQDDLATVQQLIVAATLMDPPSAHRKDGILAATALARLERRLEQAERLAEALDVLSRWPPGDGMLGMCQYARERLARFDRLGEDT